MKLNNIVVAGFALAALMLSTHVALAQEAETEAAAEGEPATTTEAAVTDDAAARDPKDNWLKVCEPLADDKQACFMRQVIVSNGQFLGSFLLRDDPGQESRLQAVAAVPLGVLLPFDLLWQIDNNKPVRVPYMLCDPQACATQLVVNEAYVNSLKKGGTLKLIAKARSADPGETIRDLVVEISLAGFTAVYDGEAALTFEQLREQESGQTALEQQLQDRAEELRRQLDGSDGTEAAPEGTPPADGAAGDAAPQQ